MEVPQEGHTASTTLTAVAGSNGGTTGLELGGGVRLGQWNVGVSLPFATYRGFDGGLGDIGNLALSGRVSFGDATTLQYAGLDVSAGLGEAYTWVNEGNDIWPTQGVAAVYGLVRRGDSLTWGVEGRFGMYFTQGYPPFPERYTRMQVVGMLDGDIADMLGVVGEVSVAHWDVSPLDLAALLRLDPVSGLRIRTGLVMPLGTWASVGPAEAVHGLREVSWTLDVRLLQ
jgi:hypothetical protein